MEAYAAKRCRPLDYFFKKRPEEEDFEGLINKQVIGGKLPGSDLELERIEHSASDEETEIAVLPEEQVEAEEEEEEALSGVSMAPGRDFEEDHITCYLKEVSSFSLLTKERETELAQIIRNGQDELVQIVGDHADENTILSDLGDKVNKLLEREKTFPGVRDKVLKVIVRTLELASKDYPENSIFSASLSRVRAIMRAVDTAKQEMVKANLRLVLSIAKRYRGRGMTFDDLSQIPPAKPEA